MGNFVKNWQIPQENSCYVESEAGSVYSPHPWLK